MGSAKLHISYIGLGSNLGNPSLQIQQAIQQIARLPDTSVTAVSSYYCNPPMNNLPQPDYINAVIAIQTAMTAQELLTKLHTIEQSQGRERSQIPNQPRYIDLDILLFDEQQFKEPRLTIPHKGIEERNFVLVPLAEIAPHLTLPNGKLVSTLADAIAKEDLLQIPAPHIPDNEGLLVE